MIMYQTFVVIIVKFNFIYNTHCKIYKEVTVSTFNFLSKDFNVTNILNSFNYKKKHLNKTEIHFITDFQDKFKNLNGLRKLLKHF